MGAFFYEGHTHLLDPETCEFCSGMGFLDIGPCRICRGHGRLGLQRVHIQAEDKKITLHVARNGSEPVQVEMTPDEARRIAVDILRDVGLILDGVG